MKYGTLPALDSKKNERMEKITNSEKLVTEGEIVKTEVKQEDGSVKIVSDDPKQITFTIPAVKFEFPEFESLTEATNDAGSEEKLLSFINDSVAARAVAKGKNYIRNATSSGVGEAGGYSDVVEKGLELCKTYSINEPEVVNASVKAKTLDELVAAAKAGTISKDDLMAKMLEMAK